jgi:hypothetical protein
MVLIRQANSLVAEGEVLALFQVAAQEVGFCSPCHHAYFVAENSSQG